VPESYLCLSKIMGPKGPKAIHLYAHPYGNLEMGDLARCLSGKVKELGIEGPVFGIGSLGSEISFFHIGRASAVNFMGGGVGRT